MRACVRAVQAGGARSAVRVRARMVVRARCGSKGVCAGSSAQASSSAAALPHAVHFIFAAADYSDICARHRAL